MSRLDEYDADWQRTKSILISSLFEDVSILTPITEESNDSIPPHDTADVPSRDEVPDKPDSPLPPLIIEYTKKPNRHDESEEYYAKLSIKMRKLYHKLFIENKDLSSEDYNLIDFEEFRESEESDNFRVFNQSSIISDKSIDQEQNNTEISSILRSDGEELTVEEESYQGKSGDQEINETEESDNASIEDEESSKDEETNNENNNNQKLNVVETDFPTEDDEESSQDGEGQETNNEKKNTQELNEGEIDDVETYSSSEGTDFRQITTEALVHVDRSQDHSVRMQSLLVPEQRLRSLIHARIGDMYDRIEVLSALEDNRDPGTPLKTDKSNEHIEVMRTPRPKISQESIEMTRWSNSDTTIEHTAPKTTQHSIPATRRSGSDAQEPTAGSSLSQDGGHNISEFKISDDINASIFNESLNAEENSFISRKRKLNEVLDEQTSKKVTWDELSGNFFVGTPKIFKLCSCDGHICN